VFHGDCLPPTMNHRAAAIMQAQRASTFLRRLSSRAEPVVSIDRSTQKITISPADCKSHSASVVFLHGLGDTSHGWAGAMHRLATALPHVRFICPTAPTRPVTLNMGMQMPAWYDLTGLGKRENEACDGLDDSRHSIMALVEAEIDAGIPADRILLGGFSQGGACSLYCALLAEVSLAGVVCMSGYLPRQGAALASTQAGLQTPFVELLNVLWSFPTSFLVFVLRVLVFVHRFPRCLPFPKFVSYVDGSRTRLGWAIPLI
jgi:predicted esterase